MTLKGNQAHSYFLALGAELGHGTINITCNRKPYMRSPIARSHLTVSDLEMSKVSVKSCLVKEPSCHMLLLPVPVNTNGKSLIMGSRMANIFSLGRSKSRSHILSAR